MLVLNPCDPDDTALNAPWAMVPLKPKELNRPPEDDACVGTMVHILCAVDSAGA